MQNKKYRIDYTQKIEEFGRTLYRIVALADFGSVATGDQGGYIESEKNLSQSGNAWVYDNAKVCDNAIVYDNARVCGKARVCGNARVYDNARVCGNTIVSGNAWVCDNARVYGNAEVYDNAIVYDNAKVYDNARVCDNAKVYGNAEVAELCITVRTRKYYCTISDTHIAIGCKNYTFSEWENFTEEEISKMDTNAWEWWTQYKPILFEILKVENKVKT